MSALMTYIDPSHKASRIGWWKNAVSKSSRSKIVEAVNDWREAFMLRRTKDILEKKLPPRNRTLRQVDAHPSELWIYISYETKFLNALKVFNEEMEDSGNPLARQRMKEVFEIMMACMSCARMSLIHPLLPGGRELTIQFSPSRKHLLKREEQPKVCVFCHPDPSQVVREIKEEETTDSDSESDSDDEHYEKVLALGLNNFGRRRRVRTNIDLDDDDLDDEDDMGVMESSTEDKKKGPIIPLGNDLLSCQVSESDCRHFAHERCIARHRESGCTICPRCDGLQSRLHENLPHTVYCQEVLTSFNHVQQGFTASAKIEEAIKWFQTAVPQNEKAIIYSFFKGSLDLIEGILIENLGIECARYDGDVDKDTREKDLNRFKTDKDCRVLLASVQSGGTGLNIVEANNVVFLDRWFNPSTHDQAESRVHRIGQKKKVEIAYLDIDNTIDVVMKAINELKEGNASVLLADGTSLGGSVSGVGYRELSGVIGNSLKAIRETRNTIIEGNTIGENQAKGEENDNTHKSAYGKGSSKKLKKESTYNVPKLVPGEGLFRKSNVKRENVPKPGEGLVGKSTLKREKKYNVPKLVPGEGLFRKSNMKKDDIPKLIPGEGLFRKSNVKKEEKDDVPKFVSGKYLVNTSREKEKKEPKISSDEIIVLSSDEEDDRDEVNLQAVARVSLEGHRAGMKNESKEIIELLSSDEEDDNSIDVQMAKRISLGAIFSSAKRVTDQTETQAQAGRRISLEKPGATDPDVN